MLNHLLLCMMTLKAVFTHYAFLIYSIAEKLQTHQVIFIMKLLAHKESKTPWHTLTSVGEKIVC